MAAIVFREQISCPPRRHLFTYLGLVVSPILLMICHSSLSNSQLTATAPQGLAPLIRSTRGAGSPARLPAMAKVHLSGHSRNKGPQLYHDPAVILMRTWIIWIAILAGIWWAISQGMQAFLQAHPPATL